MVKEYRRIVPASARTRIDRKKREEEGRREREAHDRLVASVVRPNQVFVPVISPTGKPTASPRILAWMQNEKDRGWNRDNVGDAWHDRYGMAHKEILNEVLSDAEGVVVLLSPVQREMVTGLLDDLFNPGGEEAVFDSFDTPGQAGETLGRLRIFAVGVYEQTQTKYGDGEFITDVYQRASLDVARMFDHALHTLKKKNQGD